MPDETWSAQNTSSTSSSINETTTIITIEPLGHITITDRPTSEPPQTAGKWPPEPPTESTPQDLDTDNET